MKVAMLSAGLLCLGWCSAYSQEAPQVEPPRVIPGADGVRVELEGRAPSRSGIDIKHIPAADPPMEATVEVHEQPRPRPRIILRHAGEQVQYAQPPAQYAPAPPVQYAPPAQVIYQQAPPASTQEINPSYVARLYFHTHYRSRRGLFGRTIIRPRHADSNAVHLWDMFLRRHYQNQNTAY